MQLTGQHSTWLRPSIRLFYIKPLKSNPGGCSTQRPRRSLRSLPVSIRVPNLLVKSLNLFFVCFLTRVATNKLLFLFLTLISTLLLKKNLIWLSFFLDMLFVKSPSKFITSTYQKPTFSSQYLLWNFFNSKKRKTNLILTLSHWALAIYSPERSPF